MTRIAHTDLNIDSMTFPELDQLRHMMRVPCREVCHEAGLNPATYSRWLRWSRGEAGGSCPHPRSLNALRAALSRRLAIALTAA